MLRFDVRDKKPKLYIELILMGVSAAAVVASLLFAGEWDLAIASAILSVFFTASVFVFFMTFVKQVQYNPYSYNTIMYFGFGLFIASIALTFILQTIRCFQSPDIYRYDFIMHILLRSARNYMLLSAPFVLIFAVALFVSNISLILHETKRVQNFLGMLLAVLMVAGEAALFFADYFVSGSLARIIIHEIFWNLFSAVYLYFECMIIGSMVAGAMTAKYKPDPYQDYIIILGCRVAPDGKPYPLLAGRIDKALEFYNRQIKESGKKAMFVPSGGKGSDEIISECGCMKNYLMDHGISEEDILMEDKSENTFENMRFSRDLIMAHWSKKEGNPEGKAPKVVFSTTNYHVFRSGLYSRRIKFRTIGIGAKTKWYFWPNSAVREFIGLLTGHKIKQALVLFALIAVYVALPLIVYL